MRSVRAEVLAGRGQMSEAEWFGREAEWFGREAVAIVEPTDFVFLQAMALVALGEVLDRAGKRDEAQGVLADAVRICERKASPSGQSRARALRPGAVKRPE